MILLVNLEFGGFLMRINIITVTQNINKTNQPVSKA